MRLLPNTESEHKSANFIISTLALLLSFIVGAFSIWLGLHPALPAVPPTGPTAGEAKNSDCHKSSEEGLQNPAGGWGPVRPMYAGENRPTYASFNILRDNPNIGGDERQFVGIREDGSDSTWSGRMEMKPKRTYVIRMYVHNGSTELATDVRAIFNLPTCTGHAIEINGFITSADAFPDEIWSGISVWSRENFNLSYVPDSTRYFTNGSPEAGFSLQSETGLFTSKGVALGYKKLDGRVPAGYKHVGYLTFKIRPQFAEQ